MVRVGETGKIHIPMAVKVVVRPYEFPNGGRQIFPNYLMVGLYGSPDMPQLGALGQQSLPATLQRVKYLAASYQPYTGRHVLPTLEIIASVAADNPTANGDYSDERSVAALQPWITAAQTNGVYVVLDLQPGRSDFLTQAKDYQSLLAYPNVGLALDPEWRLGPTQVPLQQIGSVNISEVNKTVDWLAKLTKDNKLPQKLLLLHEFRTDMIQGREQLNTSYTQLAYVIQMDGSGKPDAKADSWNNVRANPPAANVIFGWKNFYREDPILLTPLQTMQVGPAYISYQ